MNHDDHVRLIARGIPADSGGVWADLGSGSGAFTLALRELAGPEVEIWSVDRDESALRAQRSAVGRQFPGTALHLVSGDFTRPLALPLLDGIVAANSIHFVRDRVSLLRRWRDYLKPDGRIVLVEYDTDKGNHWVPYPVSFASLPTLARAAGFAEPELLTTHPSRHHDRIYAASLVPMTANKLPSPTLGRGVGGEGNLYGTTPRLMPTPMMAARWTARRTSAAPIRSIRAANLMN